MTAYSWLLKQVRAFQGNIKFLTPLVNKYLKKVKKTEYLPHNVSILWDLKNFLYVVKSTKFQFSFRCASSPWSPYQGFSLDPLGALSGPRPLAVILRTLQNSSTTPLLVLQVCVPRISYSNAISNSFPFLRVQRNDWWNFVNLYS